MMTSEKEIQAYKKVLRTIDSAEYIHMVNGSVENLINLFFNMYNNEILCNNINISLKQKQKKLNINN
jgi:hypothetical protein